jgi:hypothetical protein
MSGVSSQSRSKANERFRVTFTRVGRSKMDWVSVLRQQPTLPILERLVRKSGALASRDIQCLFADDHKSGTVYAGMRAVGAFRVEHLVVDDPGPFSVDHIAAVL